MAAGLGFKDFTTGEVLTAADVDGYLMQGVWVFASAAARDAAVTSPQEGNFAYLKDTNVTTYYTGSAWANLDTTGMTNPMTTTGDTIYSSSGSTPARLGIGSTGQVLTVAGGVPSWATPAAGGMTLLQSLTLSGASTTSSTLSGSYKMLRCIYYEVLGTDTYNNMTMGLRVNSDSSNIYATVGMDTYGTAGFFTAYNTAQIELNTIAYASNTKESSGIIEIPNYANGSSDAKTVTFAFAKQDDRIGNGSGRITLTNAITTLTFRHMQSGGSFTAGTVDIYGVN
jgi:hypothetical protein